MKKDPQTQAELELEKELLTVLNPKPAEKQIRSSTGGPSSGYQTPKIELDTDSFDDHIKKKLLEELSSPEDIKEKRISTLEFPDIDKSETDSLDDLKKERLEVVPSLVEEKRIDSTLEFPEIDKSETKDPAITKEIPEVVPTTAPRIPPSPEETKSLVAALGRKYREIHPNETKSSPAPNRP